MHRRQALLGAIGVLVGVTGCSSSTTSNQQGVALAGVELGNATEEEQMFHLLVEYEEDIVYWNSHELEPSEENQMSSRVVDPGITTSKGNVEVKCRVGDKHKIADFNYQNFHGECVISTFLYGFRGDQVLSSHPTTVDFELPDSIECPTDE